MSNLVSLKTAAAKLGISTRFLYYLKSREEINFHYLGSRVFVCMDEIEAKILLSTSKQQNTNKNYEAIN